ncbi:kinase domain protein (macronuclear) [Tetrahymena thermophila SB210]|uniref:Kinase domain protein n=1 Tax=Tetrahymena thermophila (strain SB210) TaxID=312017 RepID=Q23CS4_TETTS|nr:kinase domain protein [Tetrahymena thermophila SB210]EAR94640.2 kinase domain protein [Tetrahymena thermophila SB210]|eukprot:XP_001014962.2 kinase domain protein [Tetrahymena thermophila SB210]
MGKRQSKLITHNLISVISEQCLLKTYLKYIVASLMSYKKYLNLQYLANDSSSLVVAAYNKDIKQKVALRVCFSSLNCISEFTPEKSKSQCFSTLEVAENSILICKFPLIKQRQLFKITQKTKFYVEEMIYDKYIECLKSRCFQETQTLLMFKENHHLVLTLEGQFKWNQIGSKEFQELGLEISKCIHLQKLRLDLYNNSISALDIKCFSENLAKCIMLKQITLLLGANTVQSQGTHALAYFLAQLPNLTKLNLELANNNIEDIGLLKLGEQLQKCKNLEYLSLFLGWNKIEQEAFSQFGQRISQCKNLINLTIHMNANSIGDKGMIFFLYAIQKLKKLIFLEINIMLNLQVFSLFQQAQFILQKMDSLIKFQIFQ